MALPSPSALGGHTVDLQEVISSLEDELGSASADALCDAIRQDDERTIRLESLSRRGPSTLAPKKLAIELGRSEVLRALLEQDELIDDDMVATACRLRSRPCVHALLDGGWPVNKNVGYDASIMCLAVDDVEFLKWLVTSGADVNARSALDESPLSKAIACGSMDAIRFLLAEGASVHHGDLLHHTALRSNQQEGALLAEDLIQRGTDINAYRFNNPVSFRWRAPYKQLTPLHVACLEKNIPVAQVLLRHGADPHRKILHAGEEKGQSPIEMSLESQEEGLEKLFRDYDKMA